jgi:formate dehydrogenase major subunit
VADTGVPLGESTCISCGACVQVCPTGALIDRWSAYRGHDEQIDKTQTICVGCSIGCGVDVLTRNNSLVRIEGNWDASINEGVLCEVGRFKPLANTCDRIATPLVRKNGALTAATWEEALSAAADKLKTLKGKEDIAAIVSTRQPVETIYHFKKLFGESLGSDLVTTTEEGQFTQPAAKLADELGKSFEGKLNDVLDADGFMVLGTDLVKDHQVVGFFIKRVLANGTHLLVVDSKENGLNDLANKALKYSKGTAEDFLQALTAAVVKLGLAKGKTAVKAEELDALANKTGLKSEEYLDAAFVIAANQKPIILYEKGVSPVALKTFAELISAKLISVKGTANSLAAAQLGLELPAKPGTHKAVVIALGDDEFSQKMIKDFEKVEYKVVIASYASALTASADVVFPAANWLEQEGHYLNLDGQMQKSTRALTPAEEIWTTDATLIALAAKVGAKLDDNWTKELHKRTSITALAE